MSNFVNIVALLEPHVKGKLDEEILLAIVNMASMDQTLIGSKFWAVTIADGCWLTRDFSKNATVWLSRDFEECRGVYGSTLLRKAESEWNTYRYSLAGWRQKQ